jgi:hypothetical protein
MKLRVIATLVAVMAFGVGSASAQSIGVFADTGSASCNITAGAFVAVDFYINAVGTGVLPSGGGIRAAEFQLLNTLEPGTILNPTPAPGSTPAGPGPTAGGVAIAFGTCQTGPSVLLYTVQLVFLQATNVTGTLAIAQHTTPSNANFECVVMNLCDDPVFTSVCVSGGEASVNGLFDCNVAVEDKTWSDVKSLFN